MLCVKFNQVNVFLFGFLEKSFKLLYVKGYFSVDFQFYEIKSEICNYKVGLCYFFVGVSSYVKNQIFDRFVREIDVEGCYFYNLDFFLFLSQKEYFR